MTVAENVAFGLRERRVSAREIPSRVEEALATTRLAGYGGRHIEQLSGGEQQRVALARALVVRPRCLLLDEPLSSLDARLRRSMREEIRTLCKTFGLTTLYVTHDQEEALAVADRVAVMRAGRVLQLGTPAEVYRRPCSRAVATFVGETNLIEGRVLSRADGSTKVECGLGVVISTAPPSFTPLPGTPVWVSIRPESLHPPTASQEVNRFDAEALSATFLGPSVERRLRVGDVVMTMTEPGAGDASPPGRAADLVPEPASDLPQSWPPPRKIVEVAFEDVVLLPATEDDAVRGSGVAVESTT
jgi:ABC-type Fe3+/spermidine/putrescine transport system ATPase subunit